MAAIGWTTSATAALSCILPKILGAPGLYPHEIAAGSFLSNDPVYLQMQIIKTYDAAIEQNDADLARVRFRLKIAVISIAAAPVLGIVVGGITRVILKDPLMLFFRI